MLSVNSDYKEIELEIKSRQTELDKLLKQLLTPFRNVAF
jgi:hypothetical protein